MPPATLVLSVFSYSWSSEKKRVRLRVRPCYLLQSRQTKDERSYHPLAVSFPSSFYSESCTFLCKSWCTENIARLPFASSHLKSRWPTGSGSSGGYGRWYRCGHAKFVLGFNAENRKEHLIFLFCFFFLADWRKSMRAHNEKHRKKLAWPKPMHAPGKCVHGRCRRGQFGCILKQWLSYIGRFVILWRKTETRNGVAVAQLHLHWKTIA